MKIHFNSDQNFGEKRFDAFSEEKIHYKMFKAGKRWLYAGIFLLSLGSGMLGLGGTVGHAATTTQDETSATGDDVDSPATGDSYTLQSSTSDTSGQTASTDTDSTSTPATTTNQASSTANAETSAKSTTSSTLDEAKKAAATITSDTTETNTVITNSNSDETTAQKDDAALSSTDNSVENSTTKVATQDADSIDTTIKAASDSDTATVADKSAVLKTAATAKTPDEQKLDAAKLSDATANNYATLQQIKTATAGMSQEELISYVEAHNNAAKAANGGTIFEVSDTGDVIQMTAKAGLTYTAKYTFKDESGKTLAQSKTESAALADAASVIVEPPYIPGYQLDMDKSMLHILTDNKTGLSDTASVNGYIDKLKQVMQMTGISANSVKVNSFQDLLDVFAAINGVDQEASGLFFGTVQLFLSPATSQTGNFDYVYKQSDSSIQTKEQTVSVGAPVPTMGSFVTSAKDGKGNDISSKLTSSDYTKLSTKTAGDQTFTLEYFNMDNLEFIQAQATLHVVNPVTTSKVSVQDKQVTYGSDTNGKSSDYGLSVTSNGDDINMPDQSNSDQKLTASDFTIVGAKYTDSGHLAAGTYTVKLNNSGQVKVALANQDLVLDPVKNFSDTGTLTVTPAELKVSASATKAAGQPDPTNQADWDITETGTVKGDTTPTVTGITVSRSDKSEAVGDYKTTVDISKATVSDSNYKLAAAEGTLTITAKASEDKIIITPAKVTYGYDTSGTTVAADGTATPTAELTFTTSETGTDKLVVPKFDAKDFTIEGAKVSESGHLDAGTYDIELTDTGMKKVQAANPEYTINNNTGNLTLNQLVVSPKTVTITVDNQHKALNATDPKLTFTVESGGIIAGDNVNLTAVREPGEGTGSYKINVTATNDANYKLNVTPGTLTIGQLTTDAQITVHQDDVVYGQEFTPTLSVEAGSPLKVDGITLGKGDFQTVEISKSTSGHPIVGMNKLTLTTQGMEKVQALNPDYKLGVMNLNTPYFKITRATLTITPVDATKDAGTDDPDYTATETGLVGNDVVTYKVTRTDAGTADGEKIGDHALTVTDIAGHDAGNYDVTFAPAKLTINAAALSGTIAVNDLSKTYGDVTKDGNPNYEVTFTPTTATSNTASPTVATTTLTADDFTLNATDTDYTGNYLNAGDYTVSLNDAGKQALETANPTVDFSKVTFTDGTLAIAKKDVTVTAADAGKVYGDDDPKLTATASGLVGDDTIADVGQIMAFRDPGENAGTYTITAALQSEGKNYHVTDFQPGTFTITKAPVPDADKVVLTVPGATYGDIKKGSADHLDVTVTTGLQQPEDGFTANDFQINDAIYMPNGYLRANRYTMSFTDDGLKKLADLNPNYDVTAADVTAATLVVALKRALIKIPDQTKFYGDDDPKYDEIVETPDTVGGDKLSYTATRVPGEDVGSYLYMVDFDPRVGANVNYDLYSDTKTLTIKPKPITGDEADLLVTTDSQTIDYGNKPDEFTAQFGAKLTPVELTDSDFKFTDADGKVTDGVPTGVGSYTISLASGAQTKIKNANKNYQFTDKAFKTGEFVINPVKTIPGDKDTEITVNNAAIIVGNDTPTFTVSYGSKVKDAGLTNDDFNINETPASSADAPKDVGDYSLTLNDAGIKKIEDANANYVFSDGDFIGGTFKIVQANTTGTVTVNTTYTGAPKPAKAPAETQTVNVTRTASVDGDGQVTYGDWTTDAGSTTLVAALNPDSVAVSGYNATISGDQGEYTSADFADDTADVGVDTPLNVTLTRTVTYATKEFSVDNPGGTDDPAGTQAEFLTGTITVNTSYTGAPKPANGPTTENVNVSRKATLDADGKVVYSEWSGQNGETLVNALTKDDPAIAVAGFTATVGGDAAAYTSADFDQVTNAADAKTPYTAELNRTVSYTTKEFSVDNPGGTDDPVGTQAEFLTGTITVNTSYTGAPKPANGPTTENVNVSRKATLDADGKVVYSEWSGQNGETLVNALTKDDPAIAVAGFTATVGGDAAAYTSADFDQVTNAADAKTPYTAELNRTVSYTTKEFSVDNPGGTDDPAGTQAEFLTGTITVNTSYTGAPKPVNGPTTENVNVSRKATLDADGKVVYSEWSGQNGETLVNALTKDDPAIAVAGFTATVGGDAAAYTSADFDQVTNAADAKTPYTAELNRTVSYTTKEFSVDNPGGKDDPEGTQAKYLEGTITVHRENTGDYQGKVDDTAVSVSRTATLGTDGHTVNYGNWTIDGTTDQQLVKELTAAGVAVNGYKAEITAGAGYTSDDFNGVTNAADAKPGDDGYTATVTQSVKYTATGYTKDNPGDPTKGDPEGTQAKYLEGTITVHRENTGDYQGKVDDTTVSVSRTATLGTDGHTVNYGNWTIDGTTDQQLVKELTAAGVAVNGYKAEITAGAGYTSDDFNGVTNAADAKPGDDGYTATVTQSVKYTATGYTKDNPGDPTKGDPEGTQAKYLEGTITVHRENTGDYQGKVDDTTVSVSRTATLGTDGHTVNYGNWTIDGTTDQQLVKELTAAGVAVNGYKAEITAGAGYTSDDFNGVTNAADAKPGDDGYTATVTQSVKYTATGYTKDNPGDPTKGDPEGTQAKYLEGTITVHRENTGDYQGKVDDTTVSVSRTATLGTDGHTVNYGNWTIDGTTDQQLVKELTAAGVAVNGYKAEITAGAGYTSDDFNGVTNAADAKPGDDGYTATVTQSVKYTATGYTKDNPGDPTKGDPEGTQAKYLEGTITVHRENTGDYQGKVDDTTVSVSRTATLGTDGHTVNYGNWTIDGTTDQQLVKELTAAGVAVNGYKAEITAGAGYTSDDFNGVTNAADAKPGDDGYTATVTQSVKYTATGYTKDNPGDPTKGDPEGTQAKYLEGTITVHRENTGDYQGKVDDTTVSVSRTATLGTDGHTVNYGNWTIDGTTDQQLVKELTAAGVAVNGYKAEITAGAGYTSDDFNGVTNAADAKPGNDGYTATVTQSVKYTATGYTKDNPGDPTKGDPEGTQAKYLEGTITVHRENTGDYQGKVDDTTVSVSRTATLGTDGHTVNYGNWTIDGTTDQQLVKELTAAGVAVNGYKAEITAGAGYTSDDFNGVTNAADAKPGDDGYTATVTQSVKYTATGYTKDNPGDPTKGDPEGTQAKYLEGTITVHRENTGDYQGKVDDTTVSVSRTATLGTDGHTVNYGNWTIDGTTDQQLVKELTAAGVAVNGYKAEITAGAGYTSDDFNGVTNAADAKPGDDGYTATVTQSVKYTATGYTKDNPGDPTKGDPEGTQAKYLEGTITVHRENTGDYQGKVDDTTVSVSRTATLGTDGHTVNYGNWTIDGTTDQQLVKELTAAGVAVNGYKAEITAGAGYTSDDFNGVTNAADAKPGDDGYTATVTQSVKYTIVPVTKTEVGDGLSVDPKDYYNVTTTTDPEGGTTDTKVDGSGAVTEVDKHWSDGDETKVEITTTPAKDEDGNPIKDADGNPTTTSTATVTETLNGEPSLPTVTIKPGESVKTGKTTVTNDNPGVTMTHDTPGKDADGNPTSGLGETVTPDGTVTNFKTDGGTSVDPKDYYNVTTTTDPEGGTTDTKVDGSGAVTEVDKHWSDGDETKVEITTTPAKDEDGNPIKDADGNPTTTSTATVTETPNGEPSLPTVTIKPGESVKTGKTTVTNDNPGVTMTHDTPGKDADGNPTSGLGETVTPDGTVTNFKTDGGTSVDPKDYYVTTTTTDPEGGTTDTKVDGSGAVTEVDKHWSDGDETKVEITTTPAKDEDGNPIKDADGNPTTTSTATVTETPNGEPSLPTVTIKPGESVKTGKTTVTNDNPGVTMTHDTPGKDADGNPTSGLGETVTPDGTVSYFKTESNGGTSVDPKDYYVTTTTTDPEGGTTDTKVDGSGAVTEVDKHWSDGDETKVEITTTPAKDEDGNPIKDADGNPTTTSTATVTETPNGEPSLPTVTIKPGESVKTGKTTVTNDNPGVTMTHDTPGKDADGNPTSGLGETVTPDGTVTNFKTDGGTSVDPKDYYVTTTTTDPEGGTTDTKVDGSGAVTEVDKHWSDGDETKVEITTTPAKDEDGNPIKDADGNPTTTSTATVTETPNGEPSLPTVTIKPGESVKTGKTTVTNDNPGVTMTHDTPGKDADGNPTSGLGETVTPDGTVTNFKTDGGTSVDPKDYYNVTTTTDPEGGTTDTKVDGNGAVTEVDKHWSDGDETKVEITTTPAKDEDGNPIKDADGNPTTTSTATVTETPNGEPSLPTVTIKPGESVKTGKTTVTNDNPGVTMTHDTPGKDADGNPTSGLGETVTPDGTVSYFKTESNGGTSVDPKDYYVTTTTTDPEGGTTDTKVDGSGAVTEVDKHWSDGDETKVEITTTPAKDEDGNPIKDADGNPTTTSTATVTETPKGEPSLPTVTIKPGESVKTGKTTVTNDNPGVTMTHDTPGKDADGNPTSGLGETVTPDGTVSYFKTESNGGTSVDPKDYYVTTTTTDPEGGTTDTKVDGSGAVTEVDKHWSDGDETKVEITTTPAKDEDGNPIKDADGNPTTTSTATVTETPNGEPSLPNVTIKPGESVKTGKTTVTNDNPGVTMTHDTPGKDADGNPTSGLGETVTPDGTVTNFKTDGGTSVDPKDYYNVTTTTDPEGGTTDTKVDGSGAVTEVDKHWSDGDETKVEITTTPAKDEDGNPIKDADGNPTTTSTATVTETPNGEPSLPTVTIKPGESVKMGKTTVTNDNPGVTMTHDTPGKDADGNPTSGLGETVTPDGTVTNFKTDGGTSVDPKDYYVTTTTTDPEGGTTDTKVDGSGAVTEVDKHWSDGDETKVEITTTPAKDEDGNPIKDADGNPTTTSTATVTETPNGEPSLPTVTIKPGESVKTGKTTVTNDNPGVTMTHDTPGKDADGNPTSGLGETVTPDGTVSYFKTESNGGTSVDPKDYYVTTTTTDPEGGTTDTKVDGSGAVTEVDKHWSDGDETKVELTTTPAKDEDGNPIKDADGNPTTTSTATVTETPNGEPSLPTVTIKPGESVKTGKTTVTNDNPGVTMTHDTPGKDADGNPTSGLGETVTPDGTVSYFKTESNGGTSVDPKDYYVTTTTTDPEGGTTDTKVDGSGAVTEVDKHWSDGDETKVEITTTPAKDEDGNPIKDADGNPTTTSTATVTETPNGEPSLPTVTIKPGESVKTGKTTVTNDNPGVTMTHDTPGTDVNAKGAPTTDQTGTKITPDGTVTYFKVAEALSVTKDGYYTTKTTNDIDGGTTTTEVDGSGAVTEINKNWSDGDKTNVKITETGDAVFTETPNGQPSLPSKTVNPGNTTTIGRTTLTNNEPNGGIKLTHETTNARVDESVDHDGTVTVVVTPNNGNSTTAPENGTDTTTSDNDGTITNTDDDTVSGNTDGNGSTVVSDESADTTASGESTSSTVNTGQTTNGEQTSAVETNTNVTVQNKSIDQSKLPQTNEKEDSAVATIGLVILGLLAALGLKRKKRDDE